MLEEWIFLILMKTRNKGERNDQYFQRPSFWFSPSSTLWSTVFSPLPFWSGSTVLRMLCGNASTLSVTSCLSSRLLNSFLHYHHYPQRNYIFPSTSYSLSPLRKPNHSIKGCVLLGQRLFSITILGRGRQAKINYQCKFRYVGIFIQKKQLEKEISMS